MTVHFKTFELILATKANCLFAFIGALCTTGISIAFLDMAGDLGVSAHTMSLGSVVAIISISISFVLIESLINCIGRWKLLIIAIIIFLIGSLGCMCATNFLMYLVMQIIQGIGAGSAMPITQILLLSMYPKKQEGLVAAFWSIALLLGATAGPFIGGYLSDVASWRYLYGLQFFLGCICLFLAFFILRPYDTPNKKITFDWFGLLLFCLIIIPFQIILARGQHWDWLHSKLIITLGVTMIISIILFIPWEIFNPTPLIDLNIFTYKSYLIGCIIAGLGIAIIFSTLLLEPFWAKTQLGYTLAWSGKTVLITALFCSISCLALGKLLALIPGYLFVTVSAVILSITFFQLSNLNLFTSFANLASPRLLQGVGIAFFFTPIVSTTLSDIPHEKLPGAAGIFTFIRIASIGVAGSIGKTLYERRAVFYQSRFASYVIPSNESFAPIMDRLPFKDPLVKEGIIQDFVSKQAYTFALMDLFYLSAYLSILIFFTSFLLYKKPKWLSTERLKKIFLFGTKKV